MVPGTELISSLCTAKNHCDPAQDHSVLVSMRLFVHIASNTGIEAVSVLVQNACAAVWHMPSKVIHIKIIPRGPHSTAEVPVVFQPAPEL